jgi:excisionase family DNA binding protein
MSHETKLADDLLCSVAEIAEFLGRPERRIYHLHKTGSLPTFMAGGRVCARKSQLDQVLAAPK